MAEIKNRELSQFSSFLHIEDNTECIGITTLEGTPYVGIGTTDALDKLHVIGNIRSSGDVTAVNYLGNGAYLTGIATFAGGSDFVNLVVSGIATINAGIATNFTITSGTITNVSSGFTTTTNLTALSGIVTNLTGAAASFSNNLRSLSGIITSLSGTNLHYSGIATLTNLTGTGITYTNANFGTANITTGNIVSGVLTTISGTNATYTNVSGAIATFTSSVQSLSGIITSLGGTNLNYSGISTLANIVGTSATITNLVGTSATITNTIVTNETVTNLVGTSGSFNNFRSLSGIITSLSGTNINYSGIATIGIITGATSIGAVRFYGDGSALTNVAANITLQQDGSVVGAGLTTFNFTNTNGGTSLSSNIATINIAQAASGSSGMVQYKNASGIFSGSSNLSWDNTNNILTIAGTCTATNFNSTSDVNLKENIETVENALDIVSDLRGVKFNWKQNQTPSIGVIAQELEQVLPELVTQSDPKTVNYDGIIGVLIEAIKELKMEVDSLKNSINNQ